ncbi:MAG TPA: lactonase family protein [Cellvibrionaceae bacterium]|nr:lactonase family protein [Cellvibrionaceae bacterium]HMW50117.1 lactonase family protein [Cellvibrionaceae bacterium]HMW71177.1 lactonase family protein [Cellvibrionaceae bacterium]HMY41007.1 lactonase family protein [Marinagarivorans sp.]HNG59047.1 lactonase family protein [Cellvibrionaceae bacterium]
MSEYSLILGGYTDGPGQGIYRMGYNLQQEIFSAAQLVLASHNPSIGLKNGDLWYVVEEAEPGKIHVFDAGNNWQPLLTLNCGGASPCHLACNTGSGHLAVANYMGGSVSIFALDKNGLPQGAPFIIQHTGRSVTARQEAPHAHYVEFAVNKAGQLGLYAVDLGLDQVLRYPLLVGNQWGAGTIVFKAQAGDGPRHFARHPHNGKLYLLNELSSTVSVIDVADEQWTVQQRISTLPDNYQGENIAAHISISDNGQFIYTSNRGHHSIAVFAVQPDGTLESIQIKPCGGLWPRYFTLLNAAARLIVAHEHSDSVVAFAIEPDGCLRGPQAVGAVPKPTFVAQA